MLSSRNLRERSLEPKKALACVTRTKLNEAQCEKTDPKREEAGAWWNGVVGIALRGRKKPNRHRARCEGRPPRRCNPAQLVREPTTSQPVAQGRTAARERPDSVWASVEGWGRAGSGQRREASGGSTAAARRMVAKRAGAATLTTQHGAKRPEGRDRHGICTGTKTVNEGVLQLDSLHLRAATTR